MASSTPVAPSVQLRASALFFTYLTCSVPYLTRTNYRRPDAPSSTWVGFCRVWNLKWRAGRSDSLRPLPSLSVFAPVYISQLVSAAMWREPAVCLTASVCAGGWLLQLSWCRCLAGLERNNPSTSTLYEGNSDRTLCFNHPGSGVKCPLNTNKSPVMWPKRKKSQFQILASSMLVWFKIILQDRDDQKPDENCHIYGDVTFSVGRTEVHRASPDYEDGVARV